MNLLQFIADTEKKSKRFFAEYGIYIWTGLSVGILAYFMMMSLNLVNNLDGLWHLSNFIAGDWEISLGRGLQRYADRARFGIVSDPFNTVLTLLLVSAVNAIIIKELKIGGRIYGLLITVLLSVNPVICESLTYSYMSVNFGLAYLFSVLSFSSLNRVQKRRQILTAGSIAGLFLGISMAFYQAYICVTAFLVVISLLQSLCDREEPNKICLYMLSALYLILSGGIIYYGITQGLLLRANIPLATYKGAGNVTPLRILTQLPHSVRQCYLDFFAFYREKKALANLEFIDLILLGMFAFYVAAALIQFVRLIKHNRTGAVLFAVTILLLPVFCCFVLLIAAGNIMTGLMSMGLIMCPVLMGCIVPASGRLGFCMKRINLVLLAAFAWFQLSAVVNDQLALKEGKTATVTLAENVLFQLSETGCLDASLPVALIGRPANNDLFAQSAAYRMANEYAKFGCWSTDARNNRVSWAGVVYNFLGTTLNLCGDSEYQELVRLEQVADMPEFPSEGSICVIQGIVVVKVSDVY